MTAFLGGFLRVLTIVAILMPLAVHAEQEQMPDRIPGSTLVSAEETAELMLHTPGMVVIDSRHREEYDKAHIVGAVSLVDVEMTPEALVRLVPNKAAPVLFYCAGVGMHCLRSTHAVRNALGWGYTRVYWFRGGMEEWAERKLPLEH